MYVDLGGVSGGSSLANFEKGDACVGDEMRINVPIRTVVIYYRICLMLQRQHVPSIEEHASRVCSGAREVSNTPKTRIRERQ